MIDRLLARLQDEQREAGDKAGKDQGEVTAEGLRTTSRLCNHSPLVLFGFGQRADSDSRSPLVCRPLPLFNKPHSPPTHLTMPIVPITGKLRKRLWLDLSCGLGLGIAGAYAYWSVLFCCSMTNIFTDPLNHRYGFHLKAGQCAILLPFNFKQLRLFRIFF